MYLTSNPVPDTELNECMWDRRKPRVIIYRLSSLCPPLEFLIEDNYIFGIFSQNRNFFPWLRKAIRCLNRTPWCWDPQKHNSASWVWKPMVKELGAYGKPEPASRPWREEQLRETLLENARTPWGLRLTWGDWSVHWPEGNKFGFKVRLLVCKWKWFKKWMRSKAKRSQDKEGEQVSKE